MTPSVTKPEAIAASMFSCSDYESTPWPLVPGSVRDLWIDAATRFEKRLDELGYAIQRK